jgi:SlyX protein
MSKTPELEAQLAFLEDAIQSLDNALSLQQQQLLRLEERVAALGHQLREQVDRLDAVGASAAESPPPHY